MSNIIKGKRDVCELCGLVGELRPYGANGEWICFKCGMKNPEQTEKRMGGGNVFPHNNH